MKFERRFPERKGGMKTPSLHALVKMLTPLGWSTSDFVLCGSACLAVRGVRDVNDLDVFVRRQEMIHDVKSLGPHIPIEDHTPLYFHVTDGHNFIQVGVEVEGRQTHIDVFSKMPFLPVTFDQVWDGADSFSFKDAESCILDVRVMSLRHCLAVKALARRTTTASVRKDMRDMHLLVEQIGFEAK